MSATRMPETNFYDLAKRRFFKIIGISKWKQEQRAAIEKRLRKQIAQEFFKEKKERKTKTEIAVQNISKQALDSNLSNKTKKVNVKQKLIKNLRLIL